MVKATVEEFERALLCLDRLAAENILTRTLQTWSPEQVADYVVTPTLERIGGGWEHGYVALSQVYMSGRICEDLVNTLLPQGGRTLKQQPNMAIAVLEDYHLLGKRVVYSVLRGAGFMVADYGRMDVDELVENVQKDMVEVLLISTLMLPSALRVRAVRQKLDALDLDVKIVVGGAPFRFDYRLWQDVGADAMGRNASDAIKIVSEILGGTQ